MAQRQWRSDDTDKWVYGFGSGVDGDLTISSNTTEAPIDSSCSGTATQTSLSATNASFASGQLILIHQSRGTGVGAWELNRIASYTAGTITLSHALMNTYTDSGASQAQVRVLKQYNNVTVNSGVTYTAKAWDKNVGGILAFFARGTTNIVGTVNAAEKGYLGGASSLGGNPTCGEGSLADQSYHDNSNGAIGTGGGCSFASGGGNAASGGGGGYVTQPNRGGSKYGDKGGYGGRTDGDVGLLELHFGGGGGGASAPNQAAAWGQVANGGGVVAIFSKNLAVSGSITTKGSNAKATVVETGVWGASTGGGAGGSVLLKCNTATLGTALVLATAGNGGDQGTGGSVGRIHLDYSGSYTGTTSPTINARSDVSLYDVIGGSFLYNLC